MPTWTPDLPSTSALLHLALGLISYFGVYWLALNVLALIRAFAERRPPPPPDDRDRGRVLALVPSHHEGDVVVDTVRTLLEQTYEGEIEVQVLVEDFTDSTVAALSEAFAARPSDDASARELDPGRDARRLRVVAVGRREKHAKLNHALERADAAWVALLDADHRARPTWIAAALTRLAQDDAVAVQSRKRPLATSRLAQIWDAGLSHVAFELYNRASAASFDSVAFTGSTAVFRAEAIRRHGFHDCITEDTYLSYDLLFEGARIAYDERVGSYEEATPNVPSFVFRRRRWAAGHTHAFLAHLPQLLRGSAGGPVRVLFVGIGQFFLVPLAVQAFFTVQGVYYFALLTVEIRAVVLVGSALVALALTLWLSRRRSTKLSDFLVLWAVVFPYASMNGALLYLLRDAELYYFLSSFPHQAELWLAQASLLGVGLVTFAVGWAQLRSIRARHAFAFAITAPLLLAFELLSAMLGFSDLVLRRREWSKIDRRAEYDVVDEGVKSRLERTTQRVRARWTRVAYALPLIAVGVVVTNDVLSVGPCGDLTPLLWDPILVQPDDPPVLVVDVEPRAEGDRARVRLTIRVRAGEAASLALRVLDEGEVVEESRVSEGARHAVELDWPLGWATRSIAVSVAGPGNQCTVERDVPTRVLEAGTDGLRVNGEPFLLKGMVTTFSAPGVELGVDDGYAQLASVGVNAARLYHPPTDAIERAARRHHVLLIPQPEGSTWESLDVDGLLDRPLYLRRWRRLVERTEGDPFVLMLNAGNELEIDDRSPEHLARIGALLDRVDALHPGGLTTYSSFATYVDYPVDVLGINMLDSGPTYWEGALDLVDALERPFFASEAGGFVAFFESPPPLLRQWRMREQHEALVARGALGMVYFSSHDNWAQAVPPGGYNDPFSGDHPDDTRGYWTPENRPKPELEMLTELLADVALEAAVDRVAAGDAELPVRVTNRRPYRLRRVRLRLPQATEVGVGELEPGETREVRLPLRALRADPAYPEVTVAFTHRSHRGLRGGGRRRLTVPDPRRGPVLIGARGFGLEREGDRLAFTALDATEAWLVVPDGWESVRVNGRVLPVEGGRTPLALPGPTRPVEELEMSRDGRRFFPFEPGRIGTGDWFLRFRLPERLPATRSVVLAGLAATRVFASWPTGTARYPAHPYRETLIDASGRRGRVTLRVRRRRARYLSAAQSPTGVEVPIRVAEPYVFAPTRIEVRRGPR